MKKRFLLPMLLAFYLGTHNGQLALLQQNSTQPVTIYPLTVAMLPPVDQSRLAAGIEIRDRMHLAHLLEDYMS